MLKFLVYDNGEAVDDWPLRETHLIGADGNPMRCSVSVEQGQIVVEKREAGSGAFGLLHPAGELGELVLQTALLPEREEPYLLRVELARYRVMLLYTRLEEWGMFELPADHPVTPRKDLARTKFIEALCRQPEAPAEADARAQEALEAAIDAGEELALAHGGQIIQRKRHAGALEQLPIGCGVPLNYNYSRLQAAVAANFDHIQLPTPWQALAPEEGSYEWTPLDRWMRWAGRYRLPILAGPLISFEPGCAPDWLYIWEHDYDTVRDLIYEHIERLVTRYANVVRTWTVVSGLHINRHFTFNFEQIIDLTRMAAMLVRKLAPQAKIAIEIREPFGEYYSSNQRSIPPTMYTDLLLQAGIDFDVLALEYLMGQARPGQYARDLMQLSTILDLYGTLGKPLALTTAVPSQPVTSAMIAASDSDQQPVDAHCGHWRRPWSATVQSHWLEAMLQVALGKPYLESITWKSLVDEPQMALPLSGLITEDWHPKPAYRRLNSFRQHLGQSEAASEAPTAMAAVKQAEPATDPNQPEAGDAGQAPIDGEAESRAEGER
jgi:hypothetical protein